MQQVKYHLLEVLILLFIFKEKFIFLEEQEKLTVLL